MKTYMFNLHLMMNTSIFMIVLESIVKVIRYSYLFMHILLLIRRKINCYLHLLTLVKAAKLARHILKK